MELGSCQTTDMMKWLTTGRMVIIRAVNSCWPHSNGYMDFTVRSVGGIVFCPAFIDPTAVGFRSQCSAAEAAAGC